MTGFRRRFLLCLLAAALVCSVGIPRTFAQEAEGYTYTVVLYPGNQGSFPASGPLSVQSDTASVSFSERKIRITGLRRGDRVGYDASEEGAILLKDGSRYYAKGIRESGKDNSTLGPSSFAVTGDREYVVAYGIRGKIVSYRIHYRSTTGKTLLPSRTCYGNIGDRPVAAWAYVDGYLPQAYNLTRTLSADPAKNDFTFIYTPTAQTGQAASNPSAIAQKDSPRQIDAPKNQVSALLFPQEIIDLDGIAVRTTTAERSSPRNGNPALAALGILCSAAGLGTLGGLLYLVHKKQKPPVMEDYENKEE